MKIEEIVALDVAPSARSIDENGYMHVALSHITKAQVVPYWGHEIPAWEDRGLEKDKLYYAYRSPDELKKSISTWNGLPIHMEHHVDSADDPQKWTRVGSSGTDSKWSAPYVDNSLTIWDADAQEKIKDGTCKELSCAYRYTPDFTAGEFEGIPYDFVMRDIKGNHIALVEKGRAGRDVVVADAAPEQEPKESTEPVEATEPEETTEPKNPKRTGAESMPGKKNDVLENKALDDDILDDDVREKKSPVEVEKDEDAVEIVKDHDDDLTEDDDDDEDKTAEDDDDESGGEDDDAKMDKFVQSLNKPLADKLMGKLKEAFPAEGAEDDDDDDDDEPVGDDDGDDVDKPVEDDDDEDNPVEDDDEDDIKKPVEDDDDDDIGEDDDDEDEEDEEDEEPKMNAFVEALTDTQTKKLLLKLKERLMLGNKGEEAKDKKPAKDNKPAKDCGPVEDSKPAMDADTIRRRLLKDFRARSAAVRAVRKTCGDLDPMAFDSASDIYGHALKTVGIAMDRYPRAAWAGMYAAYTAAMSHIERKSTRNIDPGDFTGAFAGLKNITIGE